MHATGFLMVFLAALAGRYGVKGPWLLSCVPAALIPPALDRLRGELAAVGHGTD